ncbi:hypothetical protein [Halorhodospira neutriphila]|uniref:hypothetical protein n=1 Tax=Halorhodospira neutriphila TaxID=168379 RepID=UPI0019049EDB|nr:hypothetical protein [Halorhodospira neutriphila]
MEPLPAPVLVLPEPLLPAPDACVALPFEELVSPVDELLALEVFVVLDLLLVLPVSWVFLVDFSFESSLILDTSILNTR